jgi:cholesterol oxidase
MKKISRKEFGKWVTSVIGGAIAPSLFGAGCADDQSSQIDGEINANFTADYEALIVGSGIGGSVAAARLARKWGKKVLLVERGKRYPKGSFPREATALLAAVRRDDRDHTPRPIPLPGKSNGLFDVRSFDGVDIMVANGYGGGSLIYAAAIIEPSHPKFDAAWPATLKKVKLAPYYEIFRQVLGATPVPLTAEPERQLPRLEYYKRVAEATGGISTRVPIGIFFGKNPASPTPLGKAETNRHGAEQTSCRYCAECVLGCNYQAKSSTDLNYLYVAEKRYGMQVRTETAVDKIVPLDINGVESTVADGRYGYRVYMYDANDASKVSQVTARRLVLSAGVLGTNEILLRNRNVHRTLSKVSAVVGQRFSCNGDFLGMVTGGKVPDGNAYGPTIVQTIQYNDPNRPEVSHILEDMGLPGLTNVFDWLLSIVEQNGDIFGFWKRIRDFLTTHANPNAGFATQVFVGLDKSDGVMSLGSYGELRLRWRSSGSQGVYDAILGTISNVKSAVSGLASFYLPTYVAPFRRSMTVHPLGGCVLADDVSKGVTSASLATFGAVFNYTNLYVADASLIPSALGANPSLTIGALAEMVCEGITGAKATAAL